MDGGRWGEQRERGEEGERRADVSSYVLLFWSCSRID